MAVLPIVLFAVLGVTGVVFAGLGIFLAYSPIINDVINEGIKEQTRLDEGTEQYKRWEKLPFPLQFNVYVFNVTNAADVLTGAKPRVQECGPFVYKQLFEKRDIKYSKENDTLTYLQYVKLEFDKEKSAYSDDHEFTILNLPLQGVFQNEEAGDLPKAIENIGVDMLWRLAFGEDGIFVTITPKKLFFDGQEFCIFEKKKEEEKTEGGFLFGILDKIKDAPKKMFCDQVKTVSAANPTIVANAEKVRFSFFSHKHGHADGLYEVSAGHKDIASLGQISHWEHTDYIDIWNGTNSSCNKVIGTDSAIYAPFNNDSSIFQVFNTDICKSLTLKAKERIIFKGIHGIKAVMGIENFSNDGEYSCNCIKRTRNLDGELECFPTGLQDMYNCLKAPVILSFPHLLGVDERYRNTVEGLEPDEKKHTSFLCMEPTTGTPLQGRKRVQFNAIIRPIDPISATSNLTPALVPVIWIEESFDLPDHLADFLKSSFFNKLALLDVVTYTMIGSGAACVVVSVGYFTFPKF